MAATDFATSVANSLSASPVLNLVPSDAAMQGLSAEDAVAAHHDDDTAELFGITELCKAFGISLRAIRFYEDKGLLSPRRVNGTRVYTRRDRARLALILRAKAIGSSLAEIKHYLDLYGTQGEGRRQQMQYVFDRTSQAIADLSQKRAHIDATLAELHVINDAVRNGLNALD
ncbi:MerR family DNA-binding transcriptional regulator [Ideonella azotifigens]|uniref:HTH merR-type domain-containing protein n=1 Tax=Ideonella azotifigens TaxID=513160 RepID=A0ABN1JRU9_9BURK|nr:MULTISPECIES: MerR family DNA-binding transcriptional regulator [Ideonella]MCD2340836.1 MerR family DNA-binding transcriptional regulator [Ideonella azotifigens]HSI51156.1 MerR family DNA-binding transcriptional regulator [Ideonella sp.]